MEIVLASKSPRRREILEHLGLKINIMVSGADESGVTLTDPGKLTEKLALIKAQAVLSEALNRYGGDSVIIASDTVVYAGGEILGKPQDKDDARRMLRILSGKDHSVISAIAVVYGEKTIVSHETTFVRFRELSDNDIEKYIESGEPFDKAGGYGIQDSAAVFIERIEGDYFNVVGLPVYRLFSVLRENFGLELFDLQNENTSCNQSNN